MHGGSQHGRKNDAEEKALHQESGSPGREDQGEYRLSGSRTRSSPSRLSGTLPPFQPFSEALNDSYDRIVK